jgi:serine/threonine protein kinase
VSQSKAHIANCVQQSKFIKDPVLTQGFLARKENGGILSWGGGFGLVFKVICTDVVWAFKIWHTPLVDMEFRYKIIKEYLDKINLSYFVPFEYVKKGLFDGEKYLDTHRMRWVEGVTLDKYIEKHINEPDKLLEIANKFRKMVKDFHIHNISHGDLQHGNIMVDKNDDLYVIDYDSMFVVGLEVSIDIVNGQWGYQHPKRMDNKVMGNYLDNFSEILIFLSLQVYSEKPELWNNDTDWFLFSKEDLEHPKSCLLFTELLKSDNILISYLANTIYKQLFYMNINEIPSLETILFSNKNENKTIVTNIVSKF